MSRTLQHDLLPRATFEDKARQRWVLSFKGHLNRELRPGTTDAYRKHVLPAFKAAHGRAPETRDEIRQGMDQELAYQIWSAIGRCAQEQMWMTVGEMIEHDRPRIEQAFSAFTNRPDRKGSVDVPADFSVSEEVTAAHIHGQPGGYGLDRATDDWVSGAFYETGGNVYSMGAGIGVKESKAARVIEFIKERWPGFAPTRMLDIGCSAGGQTVVYPMEWPEAEVHGIDAGPGHVRYAHARAESIGVPVHYHLMDAEHMSFPDNHFDLVVSHNLYHEVSARGAPNILKECHRVLKPGGILVNQDLPLRAKDTDLFFQFMAEWEHLYNDEPWFMDYMQLDFTRLLKDVGFPEDTVFEEYLKLQHAGKTGPRSWFIFGGVKS